MAGYDAWYAVYEGDRFHGARAGPEAETITISGLTQGREYAIWMNAFDREGNRSQDSEVVRATPGAPGDDDEPDDDVAGDGESEDDGCCGGD